MSINEGEVMRTPRFNARAVVAFIVLGVPAIAQAGPITGNVIFDLSGDFTTRVVENSNVDSSSDGTVGESIGTIEPAIGYEITFTGNASLTNTLSSSTDNAAGWVISSAGSVIGSWLNPPGTVDDLLGQEDSIEVERELTQTINTPISFDGLGSLPVAPDGEVTYAQSIALLQDGRFADGGAGFTFGGGQGILPEGDTITGTIDFGNGNFDLRITGNGALNSLVTYTNFLTSLGVTPSSTLTTEFGDDPATWGREVLAYLPDSGSFTSSTTISPLNIAEVPVPGPLPLLGAGLAMLGLSQWRKHRNAHV